MIAAVAVAAPALSIHRRIAVDFVATGAESAGAKSLGFTAPDATVFCAGTGLGWFDGTPPSRSRAVSSGWITTVADGQSPE